MQKIKLSYYSHPDYSTVYKKDKLFKVALGNKVKEYFASEKKAISYLVALSKHLTLKLHELNQLYIMVNQEYRNKWFYVEARDANIIINKINNIENAFIKLVQDRCNYNSNYYIYQDFAFIFDNLNFIIKTLQNLSKEDKTYTEVYKLEFIKKWLDKLKDDIFLYNPNTVISETEL